MNEAQLSVFETTAWPFFDIDLEHEEAPDVTTVLLDKESRQGA
ncbi:hypothetical protein [Caballeronia sp. dw_19]|nr:hypothetical protein [Caballeronia sp. dw_19]